MIDIGTSLKWFSLIPADEPRASTTATYSVDGGFPMTFSLLGLKPDDVEQNNQLIFQASGLSPGQHRIEVVHGGNNQTTPLSLTYLVIQNAPAPARNTSSPDSLSTPTPSSSGADGSSEINGASTGAIVGGTVGGVAVLVAVILFLLLLRCRRKRNDIDHDLDQEMSLLNTIEPFSKVPSQSTIPLGPRPPSSHNLEYLSSEASGLLALATQGSTPGDLPSTIVMRHEDSGIRLTSRESMLELPPLYTPS